MSRGVRLGLFAALAITASVSYLLAAGPAVSLPEYGTVPAFELTDENGGRFDRASLLGKITVVDFVFTSCSTICPTLSAKMARLQKDVLASRLGDRVRLVSVSVDPERDTPERLRALAAQHGADPKLWRFVRGPESALRTVVVDGLKQALERRKDPAETDGVSILHSMRFVLLDDEARIRGFYDAGDDAALASLREHVLALAHGKVVLAGGHAMIGGAAHAAVNAALNGLSAILIVAGWIAIKQGARDRHRALMLSATAVSAMFLVSYLIRFAASGAHRYPGTGVWKIIYLSTLVSHMVLAVVTPFLVLRAIFLATRGRLPEHRRVVRFTYPIWLYVSVTGVLVYLLLYHPPG